MLVAKHDARVSDLLSSKQFWLNEAKNRAMSWIHQRRHNRVNLRLIPHLARAYFEATEEKIPWKHENERDSIICKKKELRRTADSSLMNQDIFF